MCLEWIFFFDHASRMDFDAIAKLQGWALPYLLFLSSPSFCSNQKASKPRHCWFCNQSPWYTVDLNYEEQEEHLASIYFLCSITVSPSLSLSLSWDSKVFNGFYWAMNVRMNSCLIGIGILDLVVICRIPVFN